MMTSPGTTLLPAVDFCGLTVTRLVLGANPFGGFSHQGPQRDEEMRTWHTRDRIHETWRRAEAAGINTIITNNETEHVLDALTTYLHAGGTLQWIAQVADHKTKDMLQSIDEVVVIGCCALYLHGGYVDECYRTRDEAGLRICCEYARSAGIPVGVASHAPEAHYWADSLDVADFHAVCFFNCGSLHDGRGGKFQLNDMFPATDCTRLIRRPCIAYKIMGAGRIDARMAFEFAFANIKSRDVVNVGMHRGDKDNMVEENAALVRQVLAGA